MHRYTRPMKEFASVTVRALDHEGLASTLTSRSADGWDVVDIVSINNGTEVVAFISRDVLRATTPTAVAHPTPEPASESTTTRSDDRAVSTTPSVPADWYKDPAGRFEYRYWDGSKWTEHVSRAGTVHKDPPTP